MTPNTLDEQLTKYLTDAHSIEQQALAQMRAAPDLAGDPEIASAFASHLTETEEHERLVAQRLQARGGKPAPVKDLAGTLTGKGFTAFARSQPDTPGKLVDHGYSYEHMEEAAYELLTVVARRAGDEETVAVAGRIRAEEQEMGRRLEALFDRAVDASLREQSPDDLGQQLSKYLADAHALEAQSITLLKRGPSLAGTSELEATYRDHLAESEEQQRSVAQRLDERGDSPSQIKDAALSLGALNWGLFFAAQPDTPAKLAGFAYAYEHLEIGAYELLLRVARRAGDAHTEALAQRILVQERQAAARLYGQLGAAMEATLGERELVS